MGKAFNILILAGVAVASFVVVPVPAEVRGDLTGEVAAIRAAAKEYAAAVDRGDVETIRKMWTPEGDYIDSSGRKFTVHDMIRQQATATTRPKVETAAPPAPDSSLRFVTPELAVEDGVMDIGVSPDGSKMTGRFTAVWVKLDGRWRLDTLREAVTSGPASSEPLQSLSWLLGEWVGTTGDAAVLVSSRWSDDGNFIVRDFLIRGDTRQDISATQRIGWDASTRQIRCWTFDSQGNRSEGVWRHDGERWLVESSDVSADGKKSKTTAVYVPGDGRFTSEVKSAWDVKDAQGPVTRLPTLHVEFKRAPDE